MTTYTVTAWCDRAFVTRFEVEADTPEAALELAKVEVDHEEAEECDDSYPWDTFSIDDGGEEKPMNWQDEQVRLKGAASKLLAACETALHELRVRCGYKGDEAAYVELSAAIAEATGRVAA